MTSLAEEAAARYAGLAAIEHGIVAAKNKAKEDLQTFSVSVGLRKGTLETPFGPVTLSENKAVTKPSITDEKAFIAWAEENHPESVETVKQLRPADRAAILADRFAVVAGMVVDTIKGDVLDFAEPREIKAGPPTPTYSASEQQRAVKKFSIAWASERATTLVSGLSLELPSGEPE